MRFDPICPVCGSREFKDFGGRPNARCANCHSMERSRLMFVLLERLGLLRKGIRVLHFAPEFGIAARLRGLASEYVTADFDIKQYEKSFPQIVAVDLAKDKLSRFRGFDLILHNHVLEHIPAPIGC